jgi:hypothetical protein
MSKRKSNKWWQKERNDEMSKSDQSSNTPPVTLRPMLDPASFGAVPTAPTPALAVVPTPPTPPARVGPPEEINDPEIVLRIGILEERMQRLALEKQVKVTGYNVRIASLQQEAQGELKKLAAEEFVTTQEIKNVRELLSKKHGVDLSLYGYNDATGTLNLLPAQQNNDSVQTQPVQG